MAAASPVDQARRDRRLGDRAAEHLGERPGVGDGLLVGGLAAERAGDEDDDARA